MPPSIKWTIDMSISYKDTKIHYKLHKKDLNKFEEDVQKTLDKINQNLSRIQDFMWFYKIEFVKVYCTLDSSGITLITGIARYSSELSEKDISFSSEKHTEKVTYLTSAKFPEFGEDKNRIDTIALKNLHEHAVILKKRKEIFSGKINSFEFKSTLSAINNIFNIELPTTFKSFKKTDSFTYKILHVHEFDDSARMFISSNGENVDILLALPEDPFWQYVDKDRYYIEPSSHQKLIVDTDFKDDYNNYYNTEMSWEECVEKGLDWSYSRKLRFDYNVPLQVIYFEDWLEKHTSYKQRTHNEAVEKKLSESIRSSIYNNFEKMKEDLLESVKINDVIIYKDKLEYEGICFHSPETMERLLNSRFFSASSFSWDTFHEEYVYHNPIIDTVMVFNKVNVLIEKVNGRYYINDIRISS